MQQQDMPGENAVDPQTPDPQQGDAENRMGNEPEEESGAGYGNHAMPDVAQEPSEPGKDAR